MKPKTQMRIGLWGIIALTFLAVCQFIFEPSNTGMKVVEFIYLIFSVVYILNVIRRNLNIVRKVFRVYLVLFVIWVIFVFIGAIIPTIFTPERWKEIPIGLVGMIIIILLCAIPIFIMRMGIRGLERVLEAESELDKTPVNNVTLKADETK
jgi:hypothetical protein